MDKMSLKTILLVVAGLFMLYSGTQVNSNEELNISARKFPLCISSKDPNLEKDDKYKQFKVVLNKVQNDSNIFNPATLKQQGKNKEKEHKLFEWIRFTKVKIDPKIIDPGGLKVDLNTPIGDGDILQQWLHISVKTKVPIKGLIVQANHGPIGIPFGNFVELKGKTSNVFCKCKDCTHHQENAHAFPCTYKPKAALTHPDVYMYHEEYIRKFENSKLEYPSEKNTKEIHFFFQYTDILCHRASVLQFLLLAVQDFGVGGGVVNAEGVLTDTYSHPTPESNDGVPYPFHPDFCDALDCGETLKDKDTVVLDQTFLFHLDIIPGFKFRYSFEYDSCVQIGPYSQADITYGSCPPGPFKCENVTYDISKVRPIKESGQVQSFQVYTDQLINESKIYESHTENNISCGCGIDFNKTLVPEAAPTFIAPTLIPWIDNNVKEPQRNDSTTIVPGTPRIPSFEILSGDENTIFENFDTMDIKNANSKYLHGICMFFSFSIAGSISIFLARFDKDVLPGVGCCAKGIWLWGHIILSIVSLLMLWLGILVICFTDTLNWDLEVIHVLFGVLAMVLVHFNYFFGWIRPVARNFRGFYITVHAILGYLSKLFGVIAMLVTQTSIAAPFNGIIVIVAELVNLLFYGLNTMVQRLTDSHMELKSRRRVCPYVEHKELSGPVPPSCKISRNLILILNICIHILIYILAVAFWQNKPLRVYSYADVYLPGNIDTNITTSAAPV